MFFVYFSIIFFTLIKILYEKFYGHRDRLLAKFKTPKSYPLIHNTLEFHNKSCVELFGWMEKQTKELGSVWYMSMHPLDSADFVLSDPVVVEKLLSSQKLIDKGADYELLIDWLGTGLLISSGKKWHHRRKIITPAFHFSILERFVEIMEEHGKTLVEKLKSHEGKIVDIFPLAGLYALDVICESAMGCKVDAQIGGGESEYIKSVKKMAEIMLERAFSILQREMIFYRFSSQYKVYKKCLKTLHDFTNKVIMARRNELEKLQSSSNDTPTDAIDEGVGLKGKKAFLDILLQGSAPDGTPLTNADIREEVDTFMFEGHDTTTSAISFCLYNIAKHPEVQKKLHAEIVEQIDADEKVTIRELSKLNYMELVIKESLRLFPSVPFFARRMTNEDFQVGEYLFPKNCSINISPYLMARNEKIFENPLEFVPERFSVETTCEKVNPYAYVPFSAGMRNCVGQKFAMNEIKSILCKLIRNFEFTLPPNREPLKIYSDLVLKSANGVKLIPKIRKL